MIPMIMMCAQLIDQADIQTVSEPVAVVLEVDESVDIDDGIIDGTIDNYYVSIDLMCGHNKAYDCIAEDIGDYYECIECGYIEVYNPIYPHECEYELVYDGDGEYSMICMHCPNTYIYEPSEQEEEIYWSQYDETELETEVD